VRSLLTAAFLVMAASAHGAMTNVYMSVNTNTLEIVPDAAKRAVSNYVVNLPGWGGTGGTNTATLAESAAAGGFAGTETIAPSGVVAQVLSVPRTDYIIVTDGGGCNPGATGRYAAVNGATNANGWSWEIFEGTTNQLVDPTSTEVYRLVTGGVEGVYTNPVGGGTIATGLVRVAYDTIIADATGIDGKKLVAGSVSSNALDAETDAAYRSGGGLSQIYGDNVYTTNSGTDTIILTEAASNGIAGGLAYTGSVASTISTGDVANWNAKIEAIGDGTWIGSGAVPTAAGSNAFAWALAATNVSVFCRTNGQALGNGTIDTVLHNYAISDSLGLYATTGLYTVKQEGVYRVTRQSHIAQSGTGSKAAYLQFVRNASNQTNLYTYGVHSIFNSDGAVVGVERLASNDVIRAMSYCSSAGASEGRATATGFEMPFICVERIAP